MLCKLTSESAAAGCNSSDTRATVWQGGTGRGGKMIWHIEPKVSVEDALLRADADCLSFREVRKRVLVWQFGGICAR